MRQSWHWPGSHSAIVREVFRRAADGAEVVFIPGSHDEAVRGYAGLEVGGVRIQPEAIHETADGRRLLVVHGDGFDGVVRYARWLYHLGDWACRSVMVLDRFFNIARRAFGLPYWLLSACLKHRVKNAVQFIADFEATLAQGAGAGASTASGTSSSKRSPRGCPSRPIRWPVPAT